MKIADLPADEAERLEALQRYEVLDTPAEIEFDDFTALAAQICGTPIALVSLVDTARQWFKSRIGLDVSETPREFAFCAHAIHRNELFVVPDTLTDPRFGDNPLVAGPPHIRFYAGAPLTTPGGPNIGTLCVIDRSPRELTESQRDALVRLGRQLVARLEHRLTNRRLARQTRFQELLLQNLPAAVISTDPEGRITSFSPGAERMLGYRADAVIGKKTPALFHDPEEVAARPAELTGELGDALASGFDVSAANARGGKPEVREWTCTREDGAQIPVTLSVSAMKDDHGTVVGLLGIAQDLTQRRAAEVERDRFFNLSLDLLCIAGFDGYPKRVNPAFTRAFGYDEAELLGRSFVDFIHPEDRPAALAQLEKLARGEPTISFDCRCLCRDGSLKWISWSAQPSVKDSVIYATGRDVSELKRTTDALRASEQNLAVTLRSIGDGVLATDAQGRITLLNPAAEHMTGWTRAEATGHAAEEVFRILHAHTREPAPVPVREVLTTGELRGIANHSVLCSRDGTERYIADSAAPMRDAGGNVSGVVLVFRDVTEEVASQAALSTARDRLQFLLSSTGAVIYATTPDGTCGTFVSENVRATLGYSTSECLEPGWWASGLHPDDRDRALSTMAALWRTGAVSHEYRFRHRDGDWRWIADDIRVVRDEHGDTLELVGAWTDVTARHVERDEAEARLREANDSLERLVVERTAQLRENELRFQRLADQSSEVFWFVQLEPERVLYVSPAVGAIWGRPADQFYEDTRLWMKSAHPDDQARVHSAWEAVISGKARVYETEYRVVRPDGTARWVMASGTALQDDAGRVTRIAGVTKDITERMDAEERMRQSLREKEILLKEIHHRVKNNLQIISSLLAMQSDNTPDADIRGLLKESIHRVRSMALIHERLYQSNSLARIELGEYTRALATFLVRSYRVSSEVQLVLEVEPTDLNIETAVPFGLILNELVSNALKHAYKDGRGGALRIVLGRAPDGALSLTVRDTGPGLPPEFDVKKSTSLGLQLVVALTKQLKGTLDVHNEGGACFRVSFRELIYADG